MPQQPSFGSPPDRLVVVMSDIEMGAGGPYDDFPRSDFLAEVIRGYAREPYRWLAVDLIFNGDTFDLLKTSYGQGYPHHITSAIARDKMQRVANTHPDFFRAIRELLQDERHSVHFVPGNHDLELFFPEVQALVLERIGVAERVHFHGHSMSVGRMHIEHGSQLDPLFRVDPSTPFVTGERGLRFLKLSWAAVALLDVVIPLQPIFYHHDRLKPKELVLKLIPEAKELLTSELWGYWTAYLRDVWSEADPLKTVSWTMVRELVRRLVAWNVDVEMSDDLQRKMMASDEFDLYVVGHQHEPGLWSHGRRKVIRTGAIRDEFMLEEDGLVQVPINKTWLEVYMRASRVMRSHLVETASPQRPKGSMPDSIFDCRDRARARLRERTGRARETQLQREQEEREKP